MRDVLAVKINNCHLFIFLIIFLYRNIRRCVNATGRLSTSGNTSPPSLNLSTPSTPTGILSSSSRPSQPPPTIVHHRGAYYTILRPTSRRTDVCYISISN